MSGRASAGAARGQGGSAIIARRGARPYASAFLVLDLVGVALIICLPFSAWNCLVSAVHFSFVANFDIDALTGNMIATWLSLHCQLS